MFESDKDTAAASEQPAKGDAPLPTQEGKDTPDIWASRMSNIRLADQGQAFATDPGRQAQAQAATKGRETGRNQTGRNANSYTYPLLLLR